MSVASKNLFALLGNDADGDSEPPAPVKTVEKTSTHTAKRNTDGAAPSKGPVAPSRRGGGVSGNEAAFRDRNAGSDRNRGKPAEEAAGRGAPRGGSSARGRGGRGARHARPADERHSKSLPSGGSDKTAAQAWGAAEGEAELKDEQAGEALAKAEQKEAAVEGDAAATPAAEEEEEDKHVSYADYLVQQAEKKAALEAEAALRLRKANEGIKENKKWANAKPLPKEEGEDYFAASGGKAKRERERKVKQVVEIDQRFVEPAHTAGGPRGGGRGGPRGGARGDGARGGGRGRGAPRGEFRGPRGGRGETASAPRTNLNPTDESAFPSLGSK